MVLRAARSLWALAWGMLVLRAGGLLWRRLCVWLALRADGPLLALAWARLLVLRADGLLWRRRGVVVACAACRRAAGACACITLEPCGGNFYAE